MSPIPFKHHKPHLMKSLSGKLQSPRRSWGLSSKERGTSSGHREGTKSAGAETERGTGKVGMEGYARASIPSPGVSHMSLSKTDQKADGSHKAREREAEGILGTAAQQRSLGTETSA